jgi:hypothetical protein
MEPNEKAVAPKVLLSSLNESTAAENADVLNEKHEYVAL